jgi:hypothetical protein
MQVVPLWRSLKQDYKSAWSRLNLSEVKRGHSRLFGRVRRERMTYYFYNTQKRALPANCSSVERRLIGNYIVV